MNDGMRVTMVVASSADGKITTHDGAGPRFTSANDKALLRRLRIESDAVVIGAGTVANDDPPFRLPETAQSERVRRGQPPTPIRAVLSARGSVSERARLFFCHSSPAVVFVGSVCPPERRRALESVADVRVADDVAVVVGVLSDEYNVQTALLEGGGETNFAFLNAGLVDELYLTISPWLIGGRSVPTPVEGDGFAFDRIAALSLLDCRIVDGEVFLRYRVMRA